MPKYLSEVHRVLGELIYMHQLNRELLETLSVTMQWIREYAKKHSIPLPDGSTYNSLLNKVDALIEEIASDEFLQHKKTDKDLTEPKLI